MTRRFEAEQFAIVPVAVLDADISDGAVRLYAVLRRFANSEGEAWPSIGTIAERLRCDHRTVQRRLRELTDAGFIVVERRVAEGRGRQRSNLYLFPPTTPGVIHRGGTSATPEGWHQRRGRGGTGATLNENQVNETGRNGHRAGDNSRPGAVRSDDGDVFIPGTGWVGARELSPAAVAALAELDADTG